MDNSGVRCWGCRSGCLINRPLAQNLGSPLLADFDHPRKPPLGTFLDPAIEGTVLVARAQQIVGAVEAEVGAEAVHQRGTGAADAGCRREVGQFEASRIALERRTIGRTGVLIYLSMGEHRAEIVADEAITKVTTPETWGEAMAALLVEVKAGRPGDGIVAAVALVGEVLAKHFPRSSADTNEIPDKLIEL